MANNVSAMHHPHSNEINVLALAQWSKIVCTYAGGAKDMTDIQLVDKLSSGSIDLTYGRSDFVPTLLCR